MASAIFNMVGSPLIDVGIGALEHALRRSCFCYPPARCNLPARPSREELWNPALTSRFHRVGRAQSTPKGLECVSSLEGKSRKIQCDIIVKESFSHSLRKQKSWFARITVKFRSTRSHEILIRAWANGVGCHQSNVAKSAMPVYNV